MGMSAMQRLVAPMTLAVLVSSTAVALSGYGPAAPSGQHPGARSPNTAATPEKTAAVPTRAVAGSKKLSQN